MENYIHHRSYREFSEHPVESGNLADLLGKLHSIELNGKPKYLYASAGGLYPVQTYLYIKDNRCENLAAGSYYFDPVQNNLVELDTQTNDIRSLYDPIINRPIFDQAAFAIFLVVDLQAIGAMYPDRALHYATLEAGHMTQLLEMSAPQLDIGLCQIGGLETEEFSGLLQLEQHHLLLHGLLGGNIPDADTTTEQQITDNTSSDRDEGEI
jgi:SagB-type dehydrogenase family enzyme